MKGFLNPLVECIEWEWRATLSAKTGIERHTPQVPTFDVGRGRKFDLELCIRLFADDRRYATREGQF